LFSHSKHPWFSLPLIFFLCFTQEIEKEKEKIDENKKEKEKKKSIIQKYKVLESIMTGMPLRHALLVVTL